MKIAIILLAFGMLLNAYDCNTCEDINQCSKYGFRIKCAKIAEDGEKYCIDMEEQGKCSLKDNFECPLATICCRDPNNSDFGLCMQNYTCKHLNLLPADKKNLSNKKKRYMFK